MNQTISTQEAVNMFAEHLDDILLAVSINLQRKIRGCESIHNEVLSLLDTDKEKELAEDLQKIRVKDETEIMTRVLKTLARKKQSLTSPHNPNRITDNDIARAKEYPIQNMYTGKLQRATGKFAWRGTCELHHEDTASFYISKDNQYHCFGCGGHGDSISYLMKTTGCNFVQAVKQLT